jgi:hypothetical protein
MWLSLHPAEGNKFLDFIVNKLIRNKEKNYFKKACLIEKNNYFCTRFENEGGIKIIRLRS